MRIGADISLSWLLFACGAVAAPYAVAQDAPAVDTRPGITEFPNDFFTGSAPGNAGDMLRRVPGFSVVEADEDVRGYAGAQGNVLIDGARPSSKREDIGDLLERIPAASVERIELIYSGASGIDMGGYAVLANVVRRREAGAQAAVEAGFIASLDGWIAPQAQMEYGRRWDDRALDLALEFEPELDDDSGRGTIRTFSPDGALLEQSRWDTRTTKDNGEASVGWRQPLAGGQLTLTGTLRGERARTDTGIRATTPDGDDEIVAEDEDVLATEVGARYVRRIGARSTLELVATQQLGRLDAGKLSQEDSRSESFKESTDTGESIGRAEMTHEWSERLSLAASLEGAFNFLESDASLLEDGVPVALPGTDVRIEEKRTEGAVSATWRPYSEWVVEAGFRIERSSITQTGDSPLQRAFTYAKPRMAVRWDADPGNQLRLSVSREVGQLDFADFVASASLDSGVVTAGNAELEPDKTWRTTVAWERRFGADAALTVGWTHDEISDVVDRVPVVTAEHAFDAPGNIGDGRRDTLSVEFSAPLDGIGFGGAHLRASLLWRRSRVTDPATGERRPISKENPVEGSIGLSQEPPDLRMSWGIELEHIAERETKYRFDEVASESEDAGWTVFVERRLGEHWRVRAEATDLAGRDFRERRDKYGGTRSAFPLEETERRERESPGYFSLTFRRNTGG